MNVPPNAHSRRLRAILGFALAVTALMAVTWWVYRPGLSGDYLFDDFGNLPAIGATGPIDNWATFWRYITSGTADPTGRPLTLLTFLIDARKWPASPYPFKVTNVILHLINGALLACVSWKLGRTLSPPGSARTATGGKSGLVIPGPAESRNPESVSITSASRYRPAGLGESEEQTDSGSPLRGVRNDDGGDTGVRNDHGADAGVRNDDHPVVIPGLPAGQNPESVSTTSASRYRAAGLGESEEQTDSGSPLHGVRKDDGEDTDVRNDGGGNTNVRSSEAGLPAGRVHETAIAIAALFGAGVWLLHPLFVSTTLYIVQREAMLPATFALVGMLGWMASREALSRGQLKRALVGMALSAWLCTFLAVLSKANGALLPILLLLTEWIVLSRRPMPTQDTQRRHKRAVSVFLIVPSVLLIAYLLTVIPGYVNTTPALRGWTVGQRVLTEPRVLTDYLRLLFIPHTHSSGLFNDQFAISTDWAHPAATLPCIALVLALIGTGFALRKRYPAIALALLFYFAAQLMESGWLPLELYYEHRNYLPAMLLFWPIGLALGRAGPLRFLKVAAGMAVLAVLAVMTSQRATLWGDGFRQAQVWAAINPDSARAQANAALYDLQHDRPRLAAARLRLSLPRHPDDIQAPINLIGAECRLGKVQPETLTAADHALAHTRNGGETTFKWFGEALNLVTRHACTGLDFNALQATLDAARQNPYWRTIRGRQQDLDHLQGQLDLAEGNPEAALQAFNRALVAAPDPGSALQQAAYFGAHGYPKVGLAHLDYFASLPPKPKPGFGMPRIHAWVLQTQDWWPREFAYLRHNLAEDAAVKAATGRPNP